MNCKLSKILKWGSLSLLSLLVVMSFWWMSMNYFGYCHAEGRFLSDEEKIDSAIGWVISVQHAITKDVYKEVNGVMIRQIKRHIPANQIGYKDVEEFRALNPNCCILSMKIGEIGEIERPAIVDRVTGRFSTYVTLRSKVRYFDENGDDSYGYYSNAISVSNCGESWTRY